MQGTESAHRFWQKEEHQLDAGNDTAVEARQDACPHAEDGLGEDVGAREACPRQPACKIGEACRALRHQHCSISQALFQHSQLRKANIAKLHGALLHFLPSWQRSFMELLMQWTPAKPALDRA